jgi:GNAT superfamily N-acetyltransferase
MVEELSAGATEFGAWREVKRMFVVPDFRRYGIARRILSALESRATELGHAMVRLETGKRQPEAVCLYESSGYREIARFGESGDRR